MDNDKDKDKDKDKRGDRAFRKSKLMNTWRCVRTVGIMQTNQMKNRNHNGVINTQQQWKCSCIIYKPWVPQKASFIRTRSILISKLRWISFYWTRPFAGLIACTWCSCVFTAAVTTPRLSIYYFIMISIFHLMQTNQMKHRNH